MKTHPDLSLTKNTSHVRKKEKKDIFPKKIILDSYERNK